MLCQGRPTGAGGIRTPVTRKGKTVFKTVAFNHSATAPNFSVTLFYIRTNKHSHQANPELFYGQNVTFQGN